MAQGRSTAGGCIALVAVLIAALVGVGILVAVFFSKGRASYAAEATEVAMAEQARGDALMFMEGEWPKLTIPEAGKSVTRKQYLAYTNDSNATKLARESFREAADRSEVRWSLRTRDISSNKGQLRGEFDLPWEIRRGRGGSNGSLHMACEFVETSREELLKLRRGDWVEVTGTLVFQEERARIIEARIAGTPPEPVAEDPDAH